MPIYVEDDNAPTAPKPDVIRAFVPEFRTAVIDTRYVPQSNLLAYIEGSSWVVDYYSQVLDVNDELKGQDISLDPPHQQYRRIWSMEFKVVQDLSQPAQDPTLNEFMLQGSANIYPFLVPQEGDMFRAGIADGREGIFKVIKVTRRQIFTDTAHVIEYQLVAANDPARIFDLERKTIQTFYFVKDFLLNLQNPLLLEADYNASKKLEEHYYDMIHLYFSQYFSREYMTLIIPGQPVPTYDHGLTEYVKCIMESFDDVHIQSIRQLNIGDDGAIGSNSLWTALMRRDPKLLKFAFSKAGLVSKNSFHQSGLMAGMRFTGIQRIVYPINPKLNVDFEHYNETAKVLIADTVVSHMLPLEVPPAGENGLVPMPLIKPVNFADGYVLSSAFWMKDTPNCSLMEKLLLDYFDFKIISSGDVLKICDSSYEWGPVEKFYYFPLIATLIRYNLRRL